MVNTSFVEVFDAIRILSRQPVDMPFFETNNRLLKKFDAGYLKVFSVICSMNSNY